MSEKRIDIRENQEQREENVEHPGPEEPLDQEQDQVQPHAIGPGSAKPRENEAAPVVVMNPAEAREKAAPPVPPPNVSPVTARPSVHVAPNLLQVATGQVETAEEKREAKEKRDLNETVHSMLIVGLVVSTTLMLIGLVEDVALQRSLPTVQPDLGQAISAALSLRPSGFFGLGLLVLIATPILRVLGSIVAFVYERDWRFAGITTLVFLIVLASIFLGRG